MWNKVKVYAPVGTEFGIVKNNDVLELVFRKPGEEWPHGIVPTGGVMTILEGCKSYAVINEEESI